MNKRIFRYQVPVSYDYAELLPKGAQILSVGPPRDESYRLDMWALVDPNEPTEIRTFRVIGTGNPIEEDPGQYIGTAPMENGALIWHVFETTGVNT